MKSKFLIILIIILLVIIFSIVMLILCNKKVVISDLKYFNFSYSKGNYYEGNINYILECDKTCIVTIKREGVELKNAKRYEVDDSFVKDIENILNKYNVGRWNGFNKSAKNVLDGKSFDLCIKTFNGVHIDASGYMKWPKHYYDVRKDIEEKFNSIKER